MLPQYEIQYRYTLLDYPQRELVIDAFCSWCIYPANDHYHIDGHKMSGITSTTHLSSDIKLSQVSYDVPLFTNFI